MSDNKWTQEPWEINDEFYYVNEHGVEVWRIDQSFNEDKEEPQDVCIAEFYGDRETAERAVECVNALAGVEEPSLFVKIGKDSINTEERIRKLIDCDLTESTYEKVDELMKHREELAESVKRLSAIIENNLNV